MKETTFDNTIQYQIDDVVCKLTTYVDLIHSETRKVITTILSEKQKGTISEVDPEV